MQQMSPADTKNCSKDGTRMKSKIYQKDGLACTFHGCSRVFKKQSLLNEHLMAHNGECIYGSGNCDKAYRRRSHLKVHMMLAHNIHLDGTGSPLFSSFHTLSAIGSKLKCPFEGCPSIFTLKDNLVRHERISHGYSITMNEVVQNSPNIKQHQCTISGCNAMFTSEYRLKRHLTTFHDIINRYKCPFEGCHSTFKYPSKARVHERTCPLRPAIRL